MRPERLSPDENRLAFKQVLVTGLAAGAVIVAGKLWLMPWLTRYLSTPDPVQAAQHFTRFIDGFALFLVLIAIWMAIYAGRILRSGQVPPPGAWGLRRSPRMGREARAAGVVLALCAVAMVALALFALRIPRQAIAARGARAAAPR